MGLGLSFDVFMIAVMILVACIWSLKPLQYGHFGQKWVYLAVYPIFGSMQKILSKNGLFDHFLV